MCIAIYKPAGEWATKAELRECFRRNPDGAGFAWHDGTKVCIKKGFFHWRSFWKQYKRHVQTETPALVHFRIATAGAKDAERCHPFAIKGGALIHNGPCVNHRFCAGDETRSDSQQLAEDFISGLNSTQVKRLAPMIQDFAGTEKIVLMFDDGEVVLINEQQGQWDHGVWWSNASYKGYGSRHFEGIPSKHNWQHWYFDDGTGDGIEDYKDVWDPRRELTSPDSCWSMGLQCYVRRYVRILDEDYEWNEEFHAYVTQPLSPSAMTDAVEQVVYDLVDGDSVVMQEVGFVVADKQDYDDLIGMDMQPIPSLAAATQE